MNPVKSLFQDPESQDDNVKNVNHIIDMKYGNIRALKRRMPHFMSMDRKYKIGWRVSQLDPTDNKNNFLHCAFHRDDFVFGRESATVNCMNFFEYAKDLGYLPKNTRVSIYHDGGFIGVSFIVYEVCEIEDDIYGVLNAFEL